MRRVLLLPAILPALTTAWAQGHGSITGAPFSSNEDVQAGMRIYRSACAACHGLQGGGGSNGVSLITGAFKHGGSDGELFRTITKGVPDTPMAAFPYEGHSVWRLIAYIRSMNVGRAAGQATGDPAKGAQLFESNGCVRCHTAGGAGGFTGPDLSSVGARRSLGELAAALLDPNASVAPEYWSLRARTRSGQAIEGIRLNEDMDSFQFRDSAGRLRSIRKADLASYQIVHTSPMPSFQGKLQPAELQDLVAYLANLQGAER